MLVNSEVGVPSAKHREHLGLVTPCCHLTADMVIAMSQASLSGLSVVWQGGVKDHICMGKNISFSELDPRSGWKEFGVPWSAVKGPRQQQGDGTR